MIEIVCTRPGQPAFEQFVRPKIVEPDPHMLTDAGHDMAALPSDVIFWLAVEAGQLAAQCAAWPDLTDEHDLVFGLNYEYGWRNRRQRWWPRTHAARQEWLIAQGPVTATTWLHDEPPSSIRTSMVVRHHLGTGWTQANEAWSLDIATQYCRQFAWPRGSAAAK